MGAGYRVAYPSAARTATPTAIDVDVPSSARGVHVVIDATAASATPSVVPKIEGIDGVSGKAYALLTGAAITAISTTTLRVVPGIVAAANLAVSDALPDRIRVTLTHGDADSLTYSVGVNFVK